MDEQNRDRDTKDHPLYEELTDEEMNEIALEARREAWEQAEQEETKRPKRVPKLAVWILSAVLLISTFSGLFQMFSIPAIDFLITSAKLSQQEDVKADKQAVVVVVTEDGKGTGFAISSDGMIITNEHVISRKDSITVVFPDSGRNSAKVVGNFPSIDIAVLQIEADGLPYLPLAPSPSLEKDEPIRFIGNPLSFKGIANEGTIIGPTLLRDWADDVVMIKAPVYRGNSGSPVMNENGEVIGIIFATLEHEVHGKVGLFIPIDLLTKYDVLHN